MFTGIIEAVGRVERVEHKGTNRSFWISAPITSELKVDQSVAHDGVCLTVEDVLPNCYKVTAIAETLDKTTLKYWTQITEVNLERSLLPSRRLDGHFVQGHVDTTGRCELIEDKQGSFEITVSFHERFASLVIEKGSIAVNGVSLTIFDIGRTSFKVAIIPYTWKHTNLKNLSRGDGVNVEFDMVGKYILRNQLSLH